MYSVLSTHPNDIRILFEPLPAGSAVHHLPPDARLGVLPDGCLPPPASGQRSSQVIRLTGVISLALAGGGAWTKHNLN